MARYEDRLARAFSSIINMLDPDVIVVGGGMSKHERIYSGSRRCSPIRLYPDARRRSCGQRTATRAACAAPRCYGPALELGWIFPSSQEWQAWISRTSMTLAWGLPAPNTVCVALAHSGQFLQVFAALRSSSRVVVIDPLESRHTWRFLA